MHPKVIVVTPTSLVSNWIKETKKWLGAERLQPVWVGDGATKETKKKLEDFVSAPVQQMLVISYENVRQHVEILKRCRFRLMICDEGHRLKNNDAKTTRSLMDLDCQRRVLLTGTPFQNNFGEFFALSDFVNPGVLGSQSQFKQLYDNPISKLHDPRCTPSQRALGEERAAELAKLTKIFILRRTSDVLENFLPPKVEHVLFCRPTETQTQLALHFLESEHVRRAFTGQASSLTCIQHLSKIFNHPELLLPAEMSNEQKAKAPKRSKANEDDEDDLEDDLDDLKDDVAEIKARFPSDYAYGSFDASIAAKLIVLEKLLSLLSAKDKIVIVSNFTKTLDVIEKLCSVEKKIPTLRLDGSTDNAMRQKYVDMFQTEAKYRVFLLSTKAGGVGLNLFAANRLVLFDSGWNPAHDAQAQARVWRDGQTQRTFIYRLLCTGTMEEKIFQRQLAKSFDAPSSKRRKLNSGPKSRISVQEIAEWQHCADNTSSPDPCLAAVRTDAITFMFVKETTPSMNKAAPSPLELDDLDDDD